MHACVCARLFLCMCVCVHACVCMYVCDELVATGYVVCTRCGTTAVCEAVPEETPVAEAGQTEI